MSSMLFESGRWEWDDENNFLFFVSSVAVSKKKQTQKNVEVQAKNLRVYLDMHFVDPMDPKEMATFRRMFYRRVRANEVDVVRIQDVRDVVMYQCSSVLPGDIIDLLHLEPVERFTRSLILYMQSFLQVMDALHARGADREQCLILGDLTHVERGWQRNLNDLRTLVAREHCCMLMAADPRSRRFHHLGGGLSTTGSQGERDIRYFELLWRFAARMVYVALFRRSFSLIEGEMNRLFRSTVFSAHIKRPQRNKNPMFEMPTAPRRSASISRAINRPQSYEYRTLYGESHEDRRIFHTHSPACVTALADNDFRILATGHIDFMRGDERLLKMWQALTLPEEMIPGSGVVLGVLGLPRNAFDTMLTPMSRLSVVAEEGSSSVNVPSPSIAPAPTIAPANMTPEEMPPTLADTHSQEAMELPPPGPRVPAPSVYPRERAQYGLRMEDMLHGQGMPFIKLREKAAKDRQKSRIRWRRWEMGNMRSKRRMSLPTHGAPTNAIAIAAKLADGLLDADNFKDSDSEQTSPAKQSPQAADATPQQASRQRPGSEGLEASTEEELQGWDE